MPTVDETTALQELLEAIRVGGPVSHGALTVVPFLVPARAEPDWLTLTEAGDQVTIEEINEGGSVPTLRLHNRAGKPVLLLDGEELVGAKQNRVLNTTVLVAAQPGQVGTLVYLRGRWFGLDALAAPGLFARAWPRLCSGYAADALGREPTVGLRPKPSSVLALLKSVTAASVPAVGLGAEHRFESKAVLGAALVVEGRVVHAMAFQR